MFHKIFNPDSRIYAPLVAVICVLKEKNRKSKTWSQTSDLNHELKMQISELFTTFLNFLFHQMLLRMSLKMK